MAYINAFVTHIRAVQDWAARNNATLDLDVRTFQMEVKCRGRYYSLYPQFGGTMGGRFVNTPTINKDTAGFIGWLPYRPMSYDVSSDKLVFKDMIVAAGLSTPSRWSVGDGAPVPDQDFILKSSRGSFGYEIDGPFRVGHVPGRERQQDGVFRGTLFAEQYIRGGSLKAWCWGQRPFFAHLRQPAAVHGDGRSTLEALVQARLAAAGVNLSEYREVRVIKDFLAYQGFTFDTVLPEAETCLLDFRYGRDHTVRSSLVSDDDLQDLGQSVRLALDRAAAAMAHTLRSILPAPVLYSLDAVVDENGEAWWLEVNSNPSLPPEGYEVMFADLFAT